MLKNMQEMFLKLLRKDKFEKKQRQLVISLVVKSLIKLQKPQRLCNRIIQKQLQMNMIKKYLTKDIYLQKKN